MLGSNGLTGDATPARDSGLTSRLRGDRRSERRLCASCAACDVEGLTSSSQTSMVNFSSAF